MLAIDSHFLMMRNTVTASRRRVYRNGGEAAVIT